MKTFLILATTLFFSGCTKIVEKKVYVQPKYPKMRILYPIKPYKITDFRPSTDGYIEVNKEQLKKASSVSQKRIHNIRFYENQNMRYNEEFVDANRTTN